MKRWRFRAVVAAVVAGFAVMAGPVPGVASSNEERGLRAIQGLSDKYHSETRAIADGFERTEECVQIPGVGYMGYHYVNPSRVDTRLESGRPEVLLYKDANGGRELTGVEYIVVDADQDLNTDDDRPVLFGHPFDGPMPGHSPGMAVHYDLHVWAWEENPSGAWAPWNTNAALSC